MERKEIDRFLREMGQAMITADAARLNRMIDDKIVFQHITGLTQGKSQWLGEIERGSVRYHKIKSTIESVTNLEHGMVHLEMVSMITASVWGAYATWCLHVTMDLRQEKPGGPILLLSQRKTLMPDNRIR